MSTTICPKCKNNTVVQLVTQNGRNTGKPYLKCRSCGYWIGFVDIDSVLNEITADNNTSTKPNPTVNLERLNEQQRSFVVSSIDGHKRVIAAAGSGKTTSMVQRVGYLVSQGVDAQKILVLVFNRKNADEMLPKVANVLGIPAMEIAANVTTSHAWAFGIIKEKSGYMKAMDNDWELTKFMKERIEEIWDDPDYRPHPAQVLAWIKSAMMYGYDVLSESEERFYTSHLSLIDARKLTKIRKLLIAFLRTQKGILFAEMPYLLERELRTNGDLRAELHGRYTHVIIDEAQDTSNQVLRILDMIQCPSVTMIGDNDQVLYRWNGAEPEENLLEGFNKRFPQNETFQITYNYRSGKKILDVSNRSIAFNYENNGGAYNEIWHKESRAGLPHSGRVERFVYDTFDTQAKDIVNELARRVNNGEHPNKFFILYRTNAEAEVFERELSIAELPYINAAGGSFWESQIAKDVIAFLRVWNDNEDETSFGRICNMASKNNVYPSGKKMGQKCATRFLGKRFTAQFPTLKSVQNGHVYGYNMIHDLITFWERASMLEFPEVIDFVLDECYIDFLKHERGIEEGDSDESLDTVERIRNIVLSFSSIQELLDYVDKQIEQGKKKKDWSEAIVISTVHRVKGLERDVVFVTSVSEGVKLVNTRDGQQAQPIGHMPHTFSLRPTIATLPLQVSQQTRMEDERCIFYVAITRAAQECYICAINGQNDKIVLRPSRFFIETMTPDELQLQSSKLLNAQ